MTTEHVAFERLNDLADGTLPTRVVAEIERHLAVCATCRDDLARLRGVLERAASLAEGIAPPAESWTAIHQRLQPRRRQTRRAPRRWVQQWALRAAAAIVLVAASSALTVVALRSKPFVSASRDATPTAVQDVPVPASVRLVDDSYTAVVDELTTTLRAQRSSLAPETISTLERTLRIIDEAIAEARAALAADPANGALLDVLSANYEQKVELLRRASELPART
jgi:anti-sigma factor RsiW